MLATPTLPWASECYHLPLPLWDPITPIAFWFPNSGAAVPCVFRLTEKKWSESTSRLLVLPLQISFSQSWWEDPPRIGDQTLVTNPLWHFYLPKPLNPFLYSTSGQVQPLKLIYSGSLFSPCFSQPTNQTELFQILWATTLNLESLPSGGFWILEAMYSWFGCIMLVHVGMIW